MNIGKEKAARRAVEFVEDGMVLGLGTGSTSELMIRFLSERVKTESLQIVCVSTSKRSEELARELGLKVKDFSEVKELDLVIDGADEVDYSLDGIKGGGGSLLYEKLVAVVSKKVIWIVDESKVVEELGAFPLPVEVVPFFMEKIFQRFLMEGYQPRRRMKEDELFLTDGGNRIIDLHLDRIRNPKELHEKLKLMPGVVETGLFLGLADLVIVGGEDRIRLMERT